VPSKVGKVVRAALFFILGFGVFLAEFIEIEEADVVAGGVGFESGEEFVFHEDAVATSSLDEVFQLNWPDGEDFPQWMNWAPLFHAILLFRKTLATPGIDGKSERIQGIRLRETLDEAIPFLLQAGISHNLHATRKLSGANLVQSLLADINSLLDHPPACISTAEERETPE
jgi:hypothetical protein